MLSTPTPEEILKEYWGYSNFRPLQRPIIDSVLSGSDTLALLPTGGGKSLCYQVPALCKGKLALVISPLIALMEDQVQQLKKRGIKAQSLHSGLDYRKIELILNNAARGAYQFLYLSPERLRTDLFQGHLPYFDLSLIAIDEAHCISQWGHEFRPSYRLISEIRPFIPDVPLIAVTATATPEVKVDILQQLSMSEPKVFSASFQRTNITWGVIEDAEEMDRLYQILKRSGGTSIVYAATRSRTAYISKYLSQRGVKALHYHAGLEQSERSRRQQLWMEGKIRVIVSTNAFGMGVDKADVRSVIHMDIPQGPEEYYQEAGRAGRDGKPSFALLITDPLKIESGNERTEVQYPGIELCRLVYDGLGSYYKIAFGDGKGEMLPFDWASFSKFIGISAYEAFHVLKQLERSGWIELLDNVNERSKVQLLLRREDLDQLVQKEDFHSLLLRQLLRLYEGILLDPVRISEEQIAKSIQSEVDQIRKSLEQLHQKEVIQYYHVRQGGQILFLRERVQKKRFFLDQKLMGGIKERAVKRWKAMAQYVHTDQCRTRSILSFFGERVAENCGQCDICLGSKAEKFSRSEKKAFTDRIEQLVQDNALTIRELLLHFSYIYEDRIHKLISELLDNEILYLGKDFKLYLR